MQHIIFKDLIETPWKNGKGTTRQIAIYPENANINDFIWRISAATVDALGPFSTFNNITRSLTLLQGDKVTLKINNQSIDMHPNTQPITFSGDALTELIQCDAPALDFGVMSNNDHAKHTLVHADFNDGQTYQRKSSTTLVLALKPCKIDNYDLNAFDSLLYSEDDADCFKVKTITRTAPLLIVEIFEYCPA